MSQPDSILGHDQGRYDFSAIDDQVLRYRLQCLLLTFDRLENEAKEFSLIVSKAKDWFMDVPAICGAIASIEYLFLRIERYGVVVPHGLTSATKFLNVMAANDKVDLSELRKACFAFYTELFGYHRWIDTRIHHDPYAFADD